MENTDKSKEEIAQGITECYKQIIDLVEKAQELGIQVNIEITGNKGTDRLRITRTEVLFDTLFSRKY